MIDTTKTFLGLTQIYPSLHRDKRGLFFESWNEEKYRDSLPWKFVQNNISVSKKGTLRGLHYQEGIFSQGKLITVISGKIFDTAVDLNLFSPYYGHFECLTLNQGDMLFVPPGFSHGFYSIEDSIIEYKVTNYYDKESERTIIYNDKSLNIPWPIKDKKSLIISEKDLRGKNFKDL